MTLADKLKEIAATEERVFAAGYAKGAADAGEELKREVWTLLMEDGSYVNKEVIIV